MRIVFLGTPEFAVPSLEILINEGYDIAAVVTQPDKPKGRGKKMAAPAVKEYALAHNILVLQPERVKTIEFSERLRELKPDLLVTCAYGKILPDYVLDVPALGCINVHGSLLPKYRGAAPIQWSIINGDKTTGITTMYTDTGMDTGDMLLKEEIEISENMTAGELHDCLSVMGARVLKDTLERLKNNTLVRTPQPEGEATYAPMMKKETGLIDWSLTALQIHNLVRGTNPWPGAYTFYKGARMRVWSTEIPDGRDGEGAAGRILRVDNSGIYVSSGKGAIRILEVQFDSGKRMKVLDYLRGHNIDEGEILG